MREKKILAALSRPGALSFDGNHAAAADIRDGMAQLKTSLVDGAAFLHEGDAPGIANTRVKIYPTGHMAFYNKEGRRFLGTDPGGHPLHEAKWGKDPATGETCLELARMQLDCLQWVGIKPRARTFSSQIDIKGQLGWEEMTLDFLREKAAEVWRAPVSEVQFFYKDENLVSLGNGKYEIKLTKDALYALPDGDFTGRTIFLSFMFRVNWARLDIIPVVELFQSTLPGCGGAVFEFIWGIYEDQSREKPLDTLRYRGLPTYPSTGAYNIFASFFIPKAPAGEEDILRVFMDTNRSHEITWSPQPNPPWRYFKEDAKICLTVHQGNIYKVTVIDDPNPVPYINRAIGGNPSCGREIQAGVNSLTLVDVETSREVPFHPSWKVKPNTDPALKPVDYPFNWKWFFNGFPPEVDPVKVIYTVPFYPQGSAGIDEPALQPLALDQIIYYMEMAPGMPAKLEKIDRVLVHTFDMVIAGCVDCTHEREYTILYSDPELAQKNAQQLWDYAAKRNQLENLKKVSFLEEKEHVEEVYKDKYGMIFKWIPMFYFTDKQVCQQILAAAAGALLPGGILFLAGPRPIQGMFDFFGLDCLYNDLMMNMPFFRQHLKMCPDNLINEDITVFLAEKRDTSARQKAQPPASSVEAAPKPPADLTTDPDIPLRGFDRDN
ncbi:hypothetical protein UZ36_02085 [Candidatus Nitromaritima sp. SCGC AAA799-C22]|nr:hypothetical protein UZ36_02085 [Candidatus Nitromaritima sp. SCGC AAA799-C22]